MNDIIWLTMRRMRTPLIMMILVYSLSVFGMTQILGQDAAGNPVQVGYLDAVYFIAILATTTTRGHHEGAIPVDGVDQILVDPTLTAKAAVLRRRGGTHVCACSASAKAAKVVLCPTSTSTATAAAWRPRAPYRS